METQEDRRRRLGVLIKARRRKLEMPNAAALAKATDGVVGVRTVEGIESGERRSSKKTDAALETALGLELGSFDQVRSGAWKRFPDDLPGQDETESFIHNEQVFTREELRTLARALGPKGFMDWLNQTHPTGGEIASSE